ncbi:hypothetical protein SAY87_000527 [Trapa incisa]|uniref:Bromo domain-containing protein n=1 Tax=Trapa incisa TaxID=236973 RepID=A0AAN7GC90_9MYRT|nr:hypothetical protein SAY87_000527 [Trapa incisa]
MGGGLQGPASSAFGTRRNRRKRKLQAIEDITYESGVQSSQEDHSTLSERPEEGSKHQRNGAVTGQMSIVPLETRLPKKHVLELVLDTLQRRDAYEIFAEPVNPEEVEDYHEIIEEPMDFGTMRAKLHEGMYESLQQFERDAFLITENAMHFNSPTTLYFRQARAIHELAKKVFCLVKTDPEKFELQFSGTRRRPTRKLAKLENCRVRFSSKSFRNATPNMEQRGAMEREPSKSALHLQVLEISAGLFEFHCYVRQYAPVNPRKKSLSSLMNQHSTPHSLQKMHILYDASISSLIPNQVNQQQISYTESLMLFTESLGPTALRIAEKKLLELGMSDDPRTCTPPKSRAPEVPASPRVHSHEKPETAQPTLKPQNSLERPSRRPVVLGCTSSRLCSSLINARKKAASIDQRSSPPCNMWTYETTSNIHGTENVDTTIRKEESATNLSSLWLQKNIGSLQNLNLIKSEADQFHAGWSHHHHHHPPQSSQFRFDLPYLKMKLEQMKSVEHEGLVYCSGSRNLLATENFYDYQSSVDLEEKYAGFGSYNGSLDHVCFSDLGFEL